MHCDMHSVNDNSLDIRIKGEDIKIYEVADELKGTEWEAAAKEYKGSLEGNEVGKGSQSPGVCIGAICFLIPCKPDKNACPSGWH